MLAYRKLACVCATLFCLAVSTAVSAPAKATSAAAKPTTVPLPLTEARVLEIAKVTGMTSAAVQLSMEYVHKYKPLLARDLDGMLQKSPRQARNRLAEAYQYARQLADTKDPAHRAKREQYLTLEMEAEQAVLRYKDAPAASRLEIEAELKSVLSKLFDFRIEEERAQLDEYRKTYNQKAEAVDQRARSKDRIVDRELTTMLGIEDKLAW